MVKVCMAYGENFIYDESMSETATRARDTQELSGSEKFQLEQMEARKARKGYELALIEMTDKVTYRAFEPNENTERLLELISSGVTTHTAAAACGINPCTIHKWAARDKAFLSRYLEARICQAWAISEELLEIADNCPADVAEVAKARIRIDTRKWLLSKVIPRIFGDKLEVTQDLKGSPQVNIILPGKGGSTPGLPPAPPDATATITLSPNSSDPIDVTPKPSE